MAANARYNRSVIARENNGLSDVNDAPQSLTVGRCVAICVRRRALRRFPLFPELLRSGTLIWRFSRESPAFIPWIRWYLAVFRDSRFLLNIGRDADATIVRGKMSSIVGMATPFPPTQRAN